MQFLLRISRGIDRFSDFFGVIIALLVLAMTLIGGWNVVGRFSDRELGTTFSSNTLLEMQWYIFALIFLLGGGYVLRHNEHVRVDVLYVRMSARGRSLVNLLGTLLFLIPFCLIAIDVSWDFFQRSYQIREVSPDPGGLPRYPIKFFVVVAFVLLLIQGVSEAIKAFAILTGHAEEMTADELEQLKSEVEEV